MIFGNRRQPSGSIGAGDRNADNTPEELPGRLPKWTTPIATRYAGPHLSKYITLSSLGRIVSQYTTEEVCRWNASRSVLRTKRSSGIDDITSAPSIPTYTEKVLTKEQSSGFLSERRYVAYKRVWEVVLGEASVRCPEGSS